MRRKRSGPSPKLNKQALALLTWYKTQEPIRTPRLRRTTKPPVVDQWLVLRWLHLTQAGEYPDDVIKSQVWKLMTEGISPVAVNWIKDYHEPLGVSPPKHGRPFIQGGQFESNRRQH